VLVASQSCPGNQPILRKGQSISGLIPDNKRYSTATANDKQIERLKVE